MDEMIEAVALAIARVVDGDELIDREMADKEAREYVVRLYKDEAEAAIEAARPFIKEECAKVADDYDCEKSEEFSRYQTNGLRERAERMAAKCMAASEIAAAIRAKN